jgi:hypothetical protein
MGWLSPVQQSNALTDGLQGLMLCGVSEKDQKRVVIQYDIDGHLGSLPRIGWQRGNHVHRRGLG